MDNTIYWLAAGLGLAGALVLIAMYSLIEKQKPEPKPKLKDIDFDAPYKLEAPADIVAVSSVPDAPEGVWNYKPAKRKPAKRKYTKRSGYWTTKRKKAAARKAKKKTRKSK